MATPDDIAATDTALAAVPPPSFLAVHPALPVVFAVAELDTGHLGTFRRSADGTSTQLDDLPTGGSHPCHVAISPEHRRQ
jgi:6-phosphogluconolactonase